MLSRDGARLDTTTMQRHPRLRDFIFPCRNFLGIKTCPANSSTRVKSDICSGDEAVVVRLALFANEPLVGFLGIGTGECLLVGVPLESLIHADGDHAEMGHAD